MNENSVKQSILVVDDTHANLQLLVEMLSDLGYKVQPAKSGRMALKAVETAPPDLILLDVNMPEMNGYEVCEQLKAQEATREIPVIFISAMNEVIDKVRAFEAGGVDYITKPFEIQVVQARITTHLNICLQKAQLMEQKQLLTEQKQKIENNYEKLKELETLRDNLNHMLVHDMRAPLTSMSVYLYLLDGIIGEIEQFSSKGSKYLKHIKALANYLIELVSSLLDTNRMESGELKLDIVSCDLNSVITNVTDSMESLTDNQQIMLDLPDEGPTVSCDPGIISRVIQNLLYNAIKYTSSDGNIRIGIEQNSGNIRISVSDNGPGIPPEYHEKIFEKFGQVNREGHKQKYSTGLGLTFCKLAVEAHGGHIGVISESGKGSTFWFML